MPRRFAAAAAITIATAACAGYWFLAARRHEMCPMVAASWGYVSVFR
jgi:hypothetical protein